MGRWLLPEKVILLVAAVHLAAVAAVTRQAAVAVLARLIRDAAIPVDQLRVAAIPVDQSLRIRRHTRRLSLLIRLRTRRQSLRTRLLLQQDQVGSRIHRGLRQSPTRLLTRRLPRRRSRLVNRILLNQVRLLLLSHTLQHIRHPRRESRLVVISIVGYQLLQNRKKARLDTKRQILLSQHIHHLGLGPSQRQLRPIRRKSKLFDGMLRMNGMSPTIIEHRFSMVDIMVSRCITTTHSAHFCGDGLCRTPSIANSVQRGCIITKMIWTKPVTKRCWRKTPDCKLRLML